MARRQVPESDFRRAEQLVDSGQSVRAAAKQTKMSPDTLRRRLRSRGDHSTTAPTRDRGAPQPPSEQPPAPPGGGNGRRRDPAPTPGPRRRQGSKPDDEQLRSMLAKIALFPAIPARLWLRCDYCAGHFVRTAPAVADDLLEAAQTDQDLRELLEWVYGSWRKYAWAGTLGMWMGLPILHHAAPGWLYTGIAPLVGMPPRESHPHTERHRTGPTPHRPASGAPEPAPATNGAAPAEPEPDNQFELFADTGESTGAYAGMDLGELLATAQAMGVRVDRAALEAIGIDPSTPGLGAILTDDAAATDEPDTAEPADLPADGLEPEAAGPAATAEAAAADTDTE